MQERCQAFLKRADATSSTLQHDADERTESMQVATLMRMLSQKLYASVMHSSLHTLLAEGHNLANRPRGAALEGVKCKSALACRA